MSTEANIHILIVDDNEMNRDVLSRRLERQGYTVVAAEDGAEALEKVQQSGVEFDLILLDIMMPRMNGYQVLEALKADTAHRHIPVIIISAMDDLESVVKCIELGADDYLFKPFNPVLLRARINASLSKRLNAPHAIMIELQGQIDQLAATAAPEQTPLLDAMRATVARLAG
jgi:DNA-binding response OmpR family regulator